MPHGTRLTTATLAINENEPCFELAEVNRMVPKAGAGLHRFQIITVIRNDKPVQWERDMGKANTFTADQFIWPGAVAVGDGRFEVLETVGHLRGCADEYRAKYDKPHVAQEPARDLKKGFEIYATRRREARHGNPVRFAMNGRGA